MKLLTLLVIAIPLNHSALAQGVKNEKDKHISQVPEVVQRLTEIAAPNKFIAGGASPDKATGEKILKEVKRIQDPEQVVVLARICRTVMGREDASDAEYDRVFMDAFWDGVYLLSEQTSDEAVASLETMGEASYLDGGDRGMFHEALLRQRAKRRQANKAQKH